MLPPRAVIMASDDIKNLRDFRKQPYRAYGRGKTSYFKFFAYFVKKYDAHDAASGVGADGAADH